MPLINITLPESVFNAEQEQLLAQKCSDALLSLEGMQASHKAQMLSWVYLHKHAQSDYFIGGKSTDKPHYRFDVTIFANTLNEAHKAELTKTLTQLVLLIEGTDFNLLNAARVWVMFHEIKDGNWGGAGQIYRLNDLMQMMQK